MSKFRMILLKEEEKVRRILILYLVSIIRYSRNKVANIHSFQNIHDTVSWKRSSPTFLSLVLHET